MAEAAQKETEAPTTNENAVEEPKKSGGMMKMLLMIGVPLILILAVGGVLMFTDLGNNLLGKEAEAGSVEAAAAKEVEPVDPNQIAYYDIPELMVNLRSKGSKSPFLRLSLKLELANKDGIKQLDLIKPRIISSFQLYLRDLSIEDLQGSAGSQRLREELLRRANNAAESVQTKVKDVLIQTFVVQ